MIMITRMMVLILSLLSPFRGVHPPLILKPSTDFRASCLGRSAYVQPRNSGFVLPATHSLPISIEFATYIGCAVTCGSYAVTVLITTW
ncbi:hypothetical protein B0J12DRAFT_659889 [Macrophomina phaseolina]|uniref:Secreted protein n=1 Tax=Macrophomina phaseolina TaxID=35725 RepID=A0ABQ8GHP5_9PEZI|nr:hypothetical protein B0J12DRAFT_659889 [Macrophomina phaseolina]